MLDREQGRYLVVLQDDFAGRIQNKSDIEETIFPVGMPRLGLRDYEALILSRDAAERIGFLARKVDRAFTGELGVIEVEHLVIESLQRTLRQSDEPNRQFQAGEPCRCFDKATNVLQVDQDVCAFANA